MAGILETFGILFESDASDVTQGAQDAENATDSLGDAIDDVDASTSDLGSSFNDLIGVATGALAAILGGGALVAGIVNASQLTDEVGKFSETLGLNIEEVQSWSEAVVRSGGDASAFQGSLSSLTEKLADFNLTGSGPAVEVMKSLGINARKASGDMKTAFDILPELADQFQKLTKSESSGLGRKLGLDQGTILLLQQGRVAVEDLVDRQKQLGVATQEDYEIAAKFNDQWADVKQQFHSLFVSAGSTILPMLTSVLEGVESVITFLKDNKDFAVAFFGAIAGALLIVLTPALATATTAAWALVAPFLAVAAPIIAAAGAFALLYDDISNFLKGNDSLIGQISEKYPIVGQVVRSLAQVVIETVDAFGEMSAWLGRLFDSPKEAINELWTLIKDFFIYLDSKIPDLDKIGDKISGVFGLGDDNEEAKNPTKVGGYRSIKDGGMGASIDAGVKLLDSIDKNPLNGVSSNSMTSQNRSVNKETNINVGDVTIQTQATDSDAIARGFSESFAEQMNKLTTDYDDGLER